MVNNDAKNQRVFFDLPKEATIVEAIKEILKKHGLEESDEESFAALVQDKDSRLMIVRDAAHLVVQKKIPLKKLVELLEKHLKTSKQVAEGILHDIKEKLVPYARIIDIEQEEKKAAEEQRQRELEIEQRKEEKKRALEQEEEKTREQERKAKKEAQSKETFREELLKKIERGKPKLPPEIFEPSLPPGVKKSEIQDVEENAEKIQSERIPIASQPKKEQPTPPEKKLPEKKNLPETSQYKKEDPYRENVV